MWKYGSWRGLTQTLSCFWKTAGLHPPLAPLAFPNGASWLMGNELPEDSHLIFLPRFLNSYLEYFPRCPYHDDRYQTTLVPVDGSSGLPFPTHYKRFIVQMFTFVNSASLVPLKEMVPNPVNYSSMSCLIQQP